VALRRQPEALEGAAPTKFREFPFQRLSGNSYARAKRLTMSRVIAA
jgi:hypothetical protein